MRSVMVGVLIVFGAVTAGAQQPPMSGGAHDMGKMGHMKTTMTTEQKIANAVSAAPREISGKATVLDWPAREGDEPALLRQGTNAWTCLPDMPQSEGNDPLCLDEPWMRWVKAYMSKTAPDVGRVGIGYMTAPGGGWGSNTDPYATKQTMDNQWGHHQPHVMIVVPDVKALEGITTDPNTGGPYVMFAGTPYAHIMAPITSGSVKK